MVVLPKSFSQNHKSNSSADTNARDAAIVTSIALQHGAELEIIRKALCRDAAAVRAARWRPRSIYWPI